MRKKLTPAIVPAPAARADNDAHRAVDILARTLWGEARGEGAGGMQAVACVVLNRVAAAQWRGGYWWGNDIAAVCLKPYQFSCWNRNDLNYAPVKHVDVSDIHFATALRLAQRAVHGRLDDLTNGATHYHARGILPKWAAGEMPCATIGRHVFYRLEVPS